MTLHAPEFTRRLRIGIQIDSQSQFVQLRVKESVPGDWFVTVLSSFRDWLLILLDSGTLEGATNKSQIDITEHAYADIGSDVFLPFSSLVAGEVQTGDAGTETVLTAASLYSFTGRSLNGVARFFLRGLHVVDFTGGYEDFRLSASENTAVAGALAELVTDGELGQHLCTSANEDVLFWKPYMNVSVSRRYINNARSS
jgi:hypothetical protein